MPVRSGWVKLHRKFTEWGWYSDENTKSVFLHLLLTANFEPSEFHGRRIEKGQSVFGLLSLSKLLLLSIQEVRTAIDHLKATGEITVQTTNKFSIATIVKYSDYQAIDDDSNKQDNTPDNKPSTNHQQTINKPSTTSKNIRKEEDKKENDSPNGESRARKPRAAFQPPSVEEVAEYCRERCNSVVPQLWHDHYTSNGWMVGKNHMKDWKAAVRTWEKNQDNRGADKDFADRNFQNSHEYEGKFDERGMLPGMRVDIFDLKEL